MIRQTRDTSPQRRSYPRLPAHLSAVVEAEFAGQPLALELFDQLLRHKTYSRPFALKLLDVARGGRTRHSWELRRLAVLMLEHQALKLSEDDADEHDLLFVKLNLKPTTGADIPLSDSVLTEGYTATNLHAFTREFRRRLARLEHVHARINGARTSAAALRDFLSVARRDCKLTLARYVFRPEEVVSRILRQVRAARAVYDVDPDQPRSVEIETARAIARLPAYEAAIMTRLSEASQTYWVSDSVSSEINSLVEYPLGTVVLVVKPPGSDFEFEIKRAGRRGRNPLGVVYARDGWTVPQSHRLDGCSIQWLLRWESKSASTLSRLYRFIHQTPAPMSQYVSRTSIYDVPNGAGAHHVLNYLTEPQIFGAGFQDMRAAMREAVTAFSKENPIDTPAVDSDIGLTVQFLSHCTPGQAVVSGTTSFRLDLIHRYLSARGADAYFDGGLGVAYARDDARRFADEVLEEILGVYRAPRVAYRSYEQYVEAAFAVPENRARADAAYLYAMREVGNFWGTLLALRGYTWGESFVARNVGLKSVWEQGEWRVKLIFMDHDNLHLPERHATAFSPQKALPVMRVDERYITSSTKPQTFATSDAGYLKGIYRADDALFRRGKTALKRAAKAAYWKTQGALQTSEDLRPFFHPAFIRRINDWDVLVESYMKIEKDEASRKAWRRRARRLLRSKNYPEQIIKSHVEAVEKYFYFIKRLAFLY